MQRVASVAQSAGVGFQDLASIMTVVSSTTRLSAETVGNGLKSLFSRLQNIKVGKYLSDEGRFCPQETISVKIQKWTRPSKDYFILTIDFYIISCYNIYIYIYIRIL